MHFIAVYVDNLFGAGNVRPVTGRVQNGMYVIETSVAGVCADLVLNVVVSLDMNCISTSPRSEYM